MDNSGHIKISRRTFRSLVEGGDPLWNEPREFSRWEAWVYMIRSAAWRDSVYKHPRGEVMLKRGETPPMSIRYLQAAWKWKSEKRVFSFVQLLIDSGRIQVEKLATKGNANGNARGNALGNTYLIVNYDVYQGGGNAEETLEETLGKQSRSSKADKQTTNGSEAAKKPTRKRNEYTAEFEEAWDVYPPRTGDSKMEAFKAWSARIREGVKAADMLAGTEQYHRYVVANRIEPRYVKKAATFYGPNLHWTESWDYGLKAA